MLKEDTSENRADGAVQSRYGNDYSRVSRSRRRVEADHIADCREGSSDYRAEHDHAARLGFKGFPEIARLPVLRANRDRPYAAEQVVKACCQGGKGERDGECVQRRIAVAPFGAREPVAPYSLGFRQGEKACV